MEEKELKKNEIYEMDLAILKFLRNQLLNNNLGYVDFNDEFINFFDTYIFYFLTDPIEEIKKRIFYNIGVGFIEIREFEKDFSEIEKKCAKKEIDSATIIIENEDGIKVINEEEYLKNFLEIKITAEGLREIDVIKEELKKNSGLNLYTNRIKEYLEKLSNIKAALGIAITFFLVIIIFVFDIKVSQIIKNIPLLSSIINVEIIEQFEKLNAEDEDYQVLNEIFSDSGAIINNKKIKQIEVKVQNEGSSKEETNKKPSSSFQFGEANMTSIGTKDSASLREKTFRVTLDNGNKQIIKLIKFEGSYKLIGPDGKVIDIPLDKIDKLNEIQRNISERPKIIDVKQSEQDKAKIIDSSIENLQNNNFMR